MNGFLPISYGHIQDESSTSEDVSPFKGVGRVF